ncbi:Clr5 domain-containing protein, partial [Xylaria arbuscula]
MPTDLTDNDWNSYRDTIRSLYITENRKLQGPGGVMQEMSTEHGFNATKAQYERRFKKWGFRKNKTKEDWEAIALKVTKRKRDNKESEVRIGGEVVLVKKLRKELSRYGYEAAFPHKFQASTPETPEGFHVCTPPFFQATTCLRNLPWFQFLAMIESEVSPYPDLVSITTNLVSSSTSTASLSQSKRLPMLDPVHTEVEKITSVLQTWAATKTLASQSNALKCVHDRLRAIIPGDFDRELSVGAENTRRLIKIDGNVQYLSLTVYLLANNNLNIEIVAAVAELFQDKRRRTALQYISGKGDIEVAEVLLAAGANVNAPPADWNSRTALQAAAESGNIELVQVLLSA